MRHPAAERPPAAAFRRGRLLGPWLPNLLSLGRLLAAPLVAWLLLDEENAAAFWLLLAALASDAVDGLVARGWHLSSPLGSLLDPLADKVLLLSSLASLWWLGLLPLWFLALAALRDSGLVFGILLQPGAWWRRAVVPSQLGRLATLLLSLLLLVLVAGAGVFALPPALGTSLLAAATAALLLSGADYLRRALRRTAGSVA